MAVLLQDLEAFYGGAPSGGQSLDDEQAQIEALLFSDGPPAAFVLLAEDDEVIVGLASYSFLWPAAGVTRSLFLKELYVRQSHRRRGVGRELMAAVFGVAEERDCSRVEWMTERDNRAARSFYGSLGFELDASKVAYRATGCDQGG
jgi:GNAT superfamily N-acetyltransferase